MVFVIAYRFQILTFVIKFLMMVNLCYPSRPNLFNVTLMNSNGWYVGGATWYGRATGSGSDGGACGYGSSVGQPPFSSMVSAGGPSLFKSGKGCGACYEIKCTSNVACSGNPTTVVITDECPGGACVLESVHFDLSGTAFGAMAVSGKADKLRNVGALQIQYKKVNCNYPGTSLVFRVDSGSNPYYFATLIEYVNGDGEVGSVELKQALSSDSWLPMKQSWGAIWKLDVGLLLRAPFSLRVTALDSGKSVIANDVIPAGWKPGQTYRSVVNFNA